MTFRTARRWLAVLAIGLGALSIRADAANVADPSGAGPYTVGTGSYTLPAAVDAKVATEIVTQLDAAVWFPKNRPTSEKRPLLLFLHGNHATCGVYIASLKARIDSSLEYTFSGTCPKGYVMAPSHLGYAYLAERLASWGYVVVSINANRGINGAPDVSGDPALILRRARLILRHLEQLGSWNAAGGAPSSIGFTLKGSLDFTNIGLFGHSRGGDAIVGAAALLDDASQPWKARLPAGARIKALFALAPTDMQTARPAPRNRAFATLLPMCDGDVYDLEGANFLDRAMALTSETIRLPKASYAVRGANHNYYNSEWQLSDASDCVGQTALFTSYGGSAAQRATALPPVVGFFRAHVGANADGTPAPVLDPGQALSTAVSDATVERAWAASPSSADSVPLARFNRTDLKSDAAIAYGLERISAANVTLPEHDRSERALSLQWTGANAAKPASITIPISKTSKSLAAMASLDLRLAPGCGGTVASPDCTLASSLNPTERYLDGQVRLIDAGGAVSAPVAIFPYAQLQGPVGISFGSTAFLHPVTQTARLPLALFTGVDLATIRSVQLSFGSEPSGALLVADIRATRTASSTRSAGSRSIPAAARIATSRAMAAKAASAPSAAQDGNVVAALRREAAGVTRAAATQVALELVSKRAFPVTGSGPRLQIGSFIVDGGTFTTSGKTDRIVFHLPDSLFASLPNGAALQVLGQASDQPWSFGALDKSKLR